MSSGTARFRPGQSVVYRPRGGGKSEDGTVTSVTERWVFVCYGLPGSTSKATDPADLEIVG